GVGAAASLGTNLVIATVPAHRAGSASAVSETAFELGAALGIALLGSVANVVYRRSLATPDGLSGAEIDVASDTIGSASALAAELPPGTADALSAAARSAFVDGVHAAGLVGALLLLLAAIAAARTLRGITVEDFEAEH